MFFQCFVGDNKSIIKNSKDIIQASSDAYGFLQIVKNFSIILTHTSDKKTSENINILVEKYLPKYLFRQKNNF